jgi:hypothetical protein
LEIQTTITKQKTEKRERSLPAGRSSPPALVLAQEQTTSHAPAQAQYTLSLKTHAKGGLRLRLRLARRDATATTKLHAPTAVVVSAPQILQVLIKVSLSIVTGPRDWYNPAGDSLGRNGPHEAHASSTTSTNTGDRHKDRHPGDHG